MKRLFCVLLIVLLSLPQEILAQSLIPMGNSIGIKLKSDEIVVTQDVILENQRTIKKGTMIQLMNKQQASLNLIQQMKNKMNSALIEYHGEKSEITLTPQDVSKLLPFLKNETEGVGTLTYIDPKTKQFGAIGHQILDVTTNAPPTFDKGYVYRVDIQHIQKSTPGIPGYKVAKFHQDEIVGEVKENELFGVFGEWKGDNIESFPEPLKIMQEKDIQLGEAQLLTSILNDEIESFNIAITKIEDGVINFEIKDPQLLQKTGGIIQGMSGSPIIQKNQFVGAVTHMYVENPTVGVGIVLREMLKKR